MVVGATPDRPTPAQLPSPRTPTAASSGTPASGSPDTDVSPMTGATGKAELHAPAEDSQTHVRAPVPLHGLRSDDNVDREEAQSPPEGDRLEGEGSVDGQSESEDGDDPDAPQCSVCICDFEEGEALRQLPCMHVYHTGCIDKWMESHSTCPNCRCALWTGATDAAPSRRQRWVTLMRRWGVFGCWGMVCLDAVWGSQSLDVFGIFGVSSP